MQRVTSIVERTVSGDVITGFEYIYDDLSRIVEEKVLANASKICYTYDVLGRVTTKTVRDLNTNAVISTENYSYDAAGNVVCAPDGCFTYDTNNRLTVFDGFAVSYDLDGNMLSNGKIYCTYDSANRLTYAGGVSYTYNAEDVRIRAFSEEEDTTYTYNTNAKLSMLLMKTTNGVVTKYVYGKGLIGEEVDNTFKTYHFDCRGSTVAITDANGNVTDTFAYDTYGKLVCRTGDTPIIFGYNGRDGVVTDSNGLVYMRARYYSPDMRRFVNADIVAGELSNAITLNRFAYANGNPVSFVDPFGLAAERGGIPENAGEESAYEIAKEATGYVGTGVDILTEVVQRSVNSHVYSTKPSNKGAVILWERKNIPGLTRFNKCMEIYGYATTATLTFVETAMHAEENIKNGESKLEIISDAAIDVGGGAWSVVSGLAGAKIGAAIGTMISPVVGSFLGTIIGFGLGIVIGNKLDSIYDNKVAPTVDGWI
jgi:RHS repeat-associated protein